ncbi:hypothetical protein M405DRAFT_327137 [Rhizopogon salebrosus TDB-379]|nr:hypothetical protein M405DRAFT_327137 [Rhizopogon salebrosus TDB-379]
MGPIATTLPCYFEPQKVYAALVRLHDTYNMHAIFSPGFLGLLQAIYVQERTVESKMPDVHSSFKKHMISTASYTTKWTSPFSRIQSRSRRNFGYGMLIPSKDRISSSPWLWPSYGSVEITSLPVPKFRNRSLPPLLFLRPRRRRCASVLDRTDAGGQKLRSQIAQWRQDWVQLVASGRDGNVLL